MQRYTVGETVWHGNRECRFVAYASSTYLMLAALLRPGQGPPDEWALGVANDASRHAQKDIRVVIYKDDDSIGLLRRSQVTRNPLPLRPFPGAEP